MTDSDKSLVLVYDALEMSKVDREFFDYNLSLMKDKSPQDYRHSIGVGLKAYEVANFLDWVSPRKLFYPALSHDFGKVELDTDLLNKKKGFNEKDMEKMRNHVVNGYNILKNFDEFSAKVVLYHHSFQKDPYPISVPENIIDDFGKKNEEVLRYSRLLSVLDFYDAVNNRINNKFGSNESDIVSVGRNESRKILLEQKADESELIIKLYEEGIFE